MIIPTIEEIRKRQKDRDYRIRKLEKKLIDDNIHLGTYKISHFATENLNLNFKSIVTYCIDKFSILLGSSGPAKILTNNMTEINLDILVFELYQAIIAGYIKNKIIGIVGLNFTDPNLLNYVEMIPNNYIVSDNYIYIGNNITNGNYISFNDDNVYINKL